MTHETADPFETGASEAPEVCTAYALLTSQFNGRRTPLEGISLPRRSDAQWYLVAYGVPGEDLETEHLLGRSLAWMQHRYQTGYLGEDGGRCFQLVLAQRPDGSRRMFASNCSANAFDDWEIATGPFQISLAMEQRILGVLPRSAGIGRW